MGDESGYLGLSGGCPNSLLGMIRAGERVLWHGRPDQAAYVRRTWRMSIPGGFMLAFSVLWTSFALFTTGLGDAPFEVRLFPLFGLIFLAMGWYLTFGHFIRSRIEWPNVVYAITDRRVIVRRGVTVPVVSAIELARVTGLTVSGTDVGDLVFEVPGAISPAESRAGWAAWPRYGWGPTAPLAPTFESIPHPVRVYRIAEEALEAARREQG